MSVIHCLQKFKHILNSTQKLYTSCLLSHFSCVWLFETLSTTTHQAPLSMGFSRQEYWSGLPFLTPGDLPDPGMEPTSLLSPTLAAGPLPLAPPGKCDNNGTNSSNFNILILTPKRPSFPLQWNKVHSYGSV